MAGGKGVSFGANFDPAFAVMGAVDGFTAEIKTDAFVSSVLKYSWEKLSAAFDLWMDMEEGPSAPDSYMHVYKWPSSWEGGGKPDYESVMRAHKEENRLWSHVYSGPAKSGAASFVFKDDTSFTPVNPILQAHDVKTGIHIFVHKATVMEYGLPVNIDPKLAKYLAFVHDPSKGKKDGAGFLSSDGTVMFHPGTIHVNQAGGGKTKNKFTTAFKLWYATRAPEIMARQILPRVELDLYRQWAQGAATIGAVNKVKRLDMTAWASSTEQSYGRAKIAARQALKALEHNYIDQAALRRETEYGE